MASSNNAYRVYKSIGYRLSWTLSPERRAIDVKLDPAANNLQQTRCSNTRVSEQDHCRCGIGAGLDR